MILPSLCVQSLFSVLIFLDLSASFDMDHHPPLFVFFFNVASMTSHPFSFQRRPAFSSVVFAVPFSSLWPLNVAGPLNSVFGPHLYLHLISYDSSWLMALIILIPKYIYLAPSPFSNFPIHSTVYSTAYVTSPSQRLINISNSTYSKLHVWSIP